MASLSTSPPHAAAAVHEPHDAPIAKVCTPTLKKRGTEYDPSAEGIGSSTCNYLITSNLTVTAGLTLPDAGVMVVRALGAAAWSMQSSDSYWFSASESPTNITFFPLHIRSSANPSNLPTQEDR
jgi:hypothetical protein